jgi:hypothetical protein
LQYFVRARALKTEGNSLVSLLISLCYMHLAERVGRERPARGQELGQIYIREAEPVSAPSSPHHSETQETADTATDNTNTDGSVQRNMLVLQAWAMFGEYAETRIAWAWRRDREKGDGEDGDGGLVRLVRREIDFNRARGWLLVGMNDIAVRTMRAVWEGEGKDNLGNGGGGEAGAMDVDEDTKAAARWEKGRWQKDAAYALANVYAGSGDGATARALAERFLVVE